MMGFAGKKTLITGAAGGIGAAILSRFRAAGAQVVTADMDTNGSDADACFCGDLRDGAYATSIRVAQMDTTPALTEFGARVW